MVLVGGLVESGTLQGWGLGRNTELGDDRSIEHDRLVVPQLRDGIDNLDSSESQLSLLFLVLFLWLFSFHKEGPRGLGLRAGYIQIYMIKEYRADLHGRKLH